MSNSNVGKTVRAQSVASQNRRIPQHFATDSDGGIDDEDLKQHRWNNVLKKISFSPPNDEYYTDCGVKPGFGFWQLLANHPKSLNKLNIPIPNSLIVLGNNSFTWLRYCKQKGGIQRKTEVEITLGDFEKTLISEIDPRYTNEDFYFLVQRTAGRVENEVSKTVFSNHGWKSKRDMGSNLDYPALYQQYIYPKSKSATITRICYKTHNYKGTQASFGFSICNKTEVHSPDYKLAISRKATLCKDAEGSFDIRELSGAVLNEFIVYCKRLVIFLEGSYRVRITEIVCDFITDINGTKYLFNVKSIRTHRISKKLKEKIEAKKKTYDELICTIYCKLCGLIFKKDDASKVLTFKLLWEFCQHAKTRGVNLKDIDFTHNTTRPCRVCDLCYKAVVAEHELIELEQKLALAQNIPIKDLFLKVQTKKAVKNRPALLKELLLEWRLMIYFSELQFRDSQKGLLQYFKEPFYLQLKMGSRKSQFLIKLPHQNSNSGRYITFRLNILRVFYLFSESLDIKDFINNTALEIRLTRTKDWNDYVCHGSTQTINGFKNKYTSGQKHESVIYLFFEDGQMIALKMVTGFVCDGNHNTASMNLYDYNGLYLPDEDFYSCNLFPIEWIEVLTDDYKQMMNDEPEQIIEEQDEETVSITKFCSNVEMKKMLNGSFLPKKPTDPSEFTNISYLYGSNRPIDKIKQFSGMSTNIKTKNSVKKSNFMIRNPQSKIKAFSPKEMQMNKVDSLFTVKLEEDAHIYKRYLAEVNNK